MKRIYLITMFAILSLCTSKVSAISRNFFHRIDVGSGNVYTFVGSNLITAFANYLTRDMLFDNSFSYTFFSGNNAGRSISTRPDNLMGVTARDIFNDAFAGIKLGYKSGVFSNVNWALYGSFHYKINQFKADMFNSGQFTRERVSFLKPGIGGQIVFGGIEHKLRFQLEVGAQYCFPIDYKGVYDSGSNNLNSGVMTHYAFKIGGYVNFSCGIYADIYHFDLFKSSFNNSMKMYNVGVTFTITPKRGEDFYD